MYEMPSNSSAFTEIKHSLRKLDFKTCVVESLKTVEKLCWNSQGVGRTQCIKQTDFAMELISEFVFHEVDRRGSKKKKLTSLEELEILEILCGYLSNPNVNEGWRNSIFMSLFPSTQADRSRLLVKLVSLSISLGNVPVLYATAILMQQVGCTSKFSIQFAQAIVNDHFKFTTKGCDNLPTIAPLFTANFMTAVAQIYYNVDKSSKLVTPPGILIEYITQWVRDNPALCITPLFINIQPALPLGGIQISALTPYTGLFRWCALYPISGLSENGNLYSQLHLSLLNSLLENEKVVSEHNVVYAQSLSSICSILKSIERDTTNKHEESINILAQAVHMALNTKCLYGNKQDMLAQLKALSSNQLMALVISKHSGN